MDAGDYDIADDDMFGCLLCDLYWIAASCNWVQSVPGNYPSGVNKFDYWFNFILLIKLFALRKESASYNIC